MKREHAENAPQVLGFPLWSSMEHMAHVCFGETCVIFFVDSKYPLTKSVHMSKEALG